VRVIVMLTAESEGGQLKCHAYWQGRDYGPVKLKLLSEKKVSLEIDKHRSDSNAVMPSSSSAETGRRRANTVTSVESSMPTPQPLHGQSDPQYVIIRKFALSHAAHPFAPIREVTHLHYPSWPDFGAPARPTHLLALVELANVMQRAALPIETSAMSRKADMLPIAWYDEPEDEARVRPMLVHCSAGCGRTGAFCTVDTVIDMLKRQRMTRVAKSSMGRAMAKPDADGDVAMEEGVSPLSTRQMSFSGAMASASQRPNSEAAGRTASAAASIPLDQSWVEDDTVDLIQKTVEDFRHQRLSMVQSLRQFVLCYEAVLEWLWRINEKSIQSAGARGGRGRSGSLHVRREG
jgi:tyrosine-protein phosphatase 2/3